jgi:DNA-binding LacI/PurR family transcriptional regulator
MEVLLAERDVPTGVVCYNDLTAVGALRRARAAGLRVPEDISIVGFDDIELASWTDPPLTTVRQPTAAMGRWAVERLTAGLGGDVGADDHVTLEPALVVRGSSGPPPQVAPTGFT